MAKKKKKKVIKKKKTKQKKKPVKQATKKARVTKKLKKGIYTVYLGLGSNVGDREEYIDQTVFLLEKNSSIQVGRRSSNFETEPEGKTDQAPFINAVVEIRTKLDPYKLLDVCHEIEATLGRERDVEWGPRTCDLDILMYDGEVISEEKLQIPHPLLHERLFALRPLAEIAPTLMHPILEKTIKSLYEERKTELGETYDDELPGFKEIKGGGYDDYERW